MYQSVSNVRITRNADINYLFDVSFVVTLSDGKDCQCYLTGESFEDIQRELGIESEDFARVDDNRCLLMI